MCKRYTATIPFTKKAAKIVIAVFLKFLMIAAISDRILNGQQSGVYQALVIFGGISNAVFWLYQLGAWYEEGRLPKLSFKK